MSLIVTSKFRGYLTSSSAITSIVPASDIKVAWVKTSDSFPCITITQVAGSDEGYLGYRSAPAGTKIRKETVSLQLDIYSKSSRLQTYQIGDEVTKVMVSGGCTKQSDIELYNDEVGVYRRTQTYVYFMFHDD